ncbi:purple acid phosphatase [Microbacterium phage A3Wally]|nr:purple acid phosphatase [Microbacterium phage A3Wally]
MTASIRSTSSGLSDGTGNTFTLTLPAGIVDGDILFFVFIAGNSSASTNDSVVKGWWRYNAQSVNTRQWAYYARIYRSTDPSSVYTLTMDAQAAGVWVAAAIKDHAVSAETDIQSSANWRRSDNGGSQTTIIAPSITTPTADRLVLALTGEASNALGAMRTVNANGFTLAAQQVEGGVANLSIEQLSMWSKVQASAGATGNLEVAFGPVETPAASLNGVGTQLSIPSGTPTADPKILGLRISTSPEPYAITLGADLIAGTTLVATLKNNGVQVAQNTVTIHQASGWGSTRFANLIPDNVYTVEWSIDGVLQEASTQTIRTLPVPGIAKSFVLAAGSCQFTGSNHPVWDRIADDNPIMLAHMGDLHYGDATELGPWRVATESSLNAPKLRALLGKTMMTWTWDNHDRIITNPTGAGTGLNLGETDPATNTEWRRLAGTQGWSSASTAGRTWTIGRVRFIQTDQWTVRDDGDGDPSPRTFLGPEQKQWFYDTLANATEPMIIWFCQWTGQNHANGRWNSFPEETTELENWINARPEIKAKMVMIGGDSHSLQVTDGTRTAAQGQRFAGIPNYNISGFNRSSETGQGGAGWLVDQPLRVAPELEANWGGYSRMTFTDTGTELTLLWEGVRVNAAGATDIMATQTFTVETEGLTLVQRIRNLAARIGAEIKAVRGEVAGKANAADLDNVFGIAMSKVSPTDPRVPIVISQSEYDALNPPVAGQLYITYPDPAPPAQ